MYCLKLISCHCKQLILLCFITLLLFNLFHLIFIPFYCCFIWFYFVLVLYILFHFNCAYIFITFHLIPYFVFQSLFFHFYFFEGYLFSFYSSLFGTAIVIRKVGTVVTYCKHCFTSIFSLIFFQHFFSGEILKGRLRGCVLLINLVA